MRLKRIFSLFLGPKQDYDAAKDFISVMFEEIAKEKEKNLFTHLTCATSKYHGDHGHFRVGPFK